MTYGEAILAGYRNGDIKWFQGYISRKINPYDQPVKVARGTRKGQLYVELPSYISNSYHCRQYLIKED